LRVCRFARRLKLTWIFRQWDATDFICETGLLPRHHSEIIHGKTQTMRLENVVTICMALRLTKRQADDVLRAARLALSNSEEDEYLEYLLETKVGWSLEDCNAFLTEMGQSELGSKPKKIANF